MMTNEEEDRHTEDMLEKHPEFRQIYEDLMKIVREDAERRERLGIEPWEERYEKPIDDDAGGSGGDDSVCTHRGS